MNANLKVEANVGAPQVAYKETIKGTAEGEGKYIKQSGGHGQYGHCWVRVEPKAEVKDTSLLMKSKAEQFPVNLSDRSKKVSGNRWKMAL